MARAFAPSAAALLVVAALAGCGGKGAAPQGRAATRPLGAPEAAVARLADAVRADDARAACRALTLATRRVVARVGAPGARCPTALEGFLVVHGLRRTLPAATGLVATRAGSSRARVRGAGLPEPLDAVGNAGGWRVSLVGVAGVRADVAAAEACSGFFARADAQPLPPFTPAALAERLRAEARLVDGARRRLRALPAGGPARLGLPDVLTALATVRAGLRTQARRVAAGGDVARGVQAAVRADRLVRRLLRSEGGKARIACPRDVTAGPELPARRRVLDRACERYAGVLDALGPDPLGPLEAQAGLRRVDRALAGLDGSLRRAPVGPGLGTLRARARAAVAAMRAALASVGAGGGAAALDRVEGYGAQVDAALVRLGATCLDGPAPGGAPPSGGAPRPLPSPRAPRPRGTFPPGTLDA